MLQGFCQLAGNEMTEIKERKWSDTFRYDAATHIYFFLLPTCATYFFSFSKLKDWRTIKLLKRVLPCLRWAAPGYTCMCVVNNPTIYTKTTVPQNKMLYGSGRPWTRLPAQSGSFFFFLAIMSVKWLQNKLKWKENYYKEAITDGQSSSKRQSNGKWPQRSQREFRKMTRAPQSDRKWAQRESNCL